MVGDPWPLSRGAQEPAVMVNPPTCLRGQDSAWLCCPWLPIPGLSSLQCPRHRLSPVSARAIYTLPQAWPAGRLPCTWRTGRPGGVLGRAGSWAWARGPAGDRVEVESGDRWVLPGQGWPSRRGQVSARQGRHMIPTWSHEWEYWGSIPLWAL